ncbi:alpha/beta hydrolase [Bradyrhizobium sp. U87765 SZCCT0131]|uniref:alpha/beta fold hydrolase n=1 Tax=unclassified Bradyrhizobium TaxID=2631580 RepID=UPI001BA8D9A3|nr:alpha/beta hydrolase [Bradyrhizobium sp. U87765 SZCCT0131]MBR1260553.1 alpha/beta hydrolase [Bradyrhizobium sp. U87765 SZCCT0134]MBR1303999.1 alpha/beta hydrolase [Bradyrhizobium sp. U87765 SZCCT0110]MBR1319605.1 alpha/beta hydrolase [Bradyrhizobium sp. U87765 SZCCT0109]MBR1347930.1 alpha/beta hydrolase [Bradyrhizobium sp. U87765 SZCCT0048]
MTDVVEFASVEGLELAYDERGPVSGPAVLLIMGLGTQMIAWPENFCNQLADAGYRVIRFDNRDIGLSTKLVEAPRVRLASMLFKTVLGRKIDAPYTLDDMAADAVGLLDALDIEDAHIVGASMGGMIAQIVAARYPERTRSLVSIMSSSGDRKLPRPKPRVNAVMFGRRPNAENREQLVRYGMKLFRTIGSPAYPTPPEVLRQKVEAAVDRSYYPLGAVRQLAAIMASGSRVDLLETITAPTLVLHGADDPLVPVEGGIDTAAHVRGARLKIIPGMGHDFPAEVTPMLADDIVRHCRAADRSVKTRFDDREAADEFALRSPRGRHPTAVAAQAGA